MKKNITQAKKDVAALRQQKQDKANKKAETYDRIGEEVKKELKAERDVRCAKETGGSGGVVPSFMGFIVIILLLHV